MTNQPPERKKRTERDYVILGVLLAVMAQVLYDSVKEVILGDVRLEYVDFVAGIVVILAVWFAWKWTNPKPSTGP
jgi:hypothetical protein